MQCYPVAGYPLGIKATWQPRQAGTGDPSPDNIRAISGMESVTVTSGGKNWFNSNWVHGVRASETGEFFSHDGASSRYTTVEHIIPIVGGGTYVLSWGGDEQNPASLFNILCYNDSTFLRAMSNPSGGNTFTAPDDVNGVAFNLQSRDEFTTNYITNGQLELGSTPTAYAPYTVTTHALTLPETIYGGTVDAVTGVGERTVDVISLAVADMDNEEVFPGWRNQNWIGNYVQDTKQDEFFKNVADYIASNADGGRKLRFNGAKYIYFTSNVAGIGLTQSELKTQYPDLVFQFAFKRLAPTSIQATGGQSLPALSGENVLITNADSLTVTGRADPTHTIQALADRIAALETAAVEGGTTT